MHHAEAGAAVGQLADPRLRAFNTVMLATTYMEDDLEAACGIGATPSTWRPNCARTGALRYVGDLRTRINRRRPKEPMAVRFNDQLTHTLGAAS